MDLVLIFNNLHTLFLRMDNLSFLFTKYTVKS